MKCRGHIPVKTEDKMVGNAMCSSTFRRRPVPVAALNYLKVMLARSPREAIKSTANSGVVRSSALLLETFVCLQTGK